MDTRELQIENERLQARLRVLEAEVEDLNARLERQRLQAGVQIERLRLLTEVAARVASTLDLEELLPMIMEAATGVMQAEASALLLVEDDKYLVFEVALGEKADEVRVFRLRKGEGIAGWVWEHGRSLLIPEAGNDPRHARQIAESIGFPVQSILCSPMRSLDRTIGVMEVLTREGSGRVPFSDEDIRLLEAFADLSATAIVQARAFRDLKSLLDGTIRAISAALDARDSYTAGHSERVTAYALAIAREIGLASSELEDLHLAGLLHDVGKIGVPDAVLLKPGALTPQEFESIRQHPMIGYRIIQPIPQLARALDGIRHHHERVDGRGYPDGLAGEAIPLQGRILAVADCFDALTSRRSYRDQIGAEEALALMDSISGQHDPRLVQALGRVYQMGALEEALKGARNDVPACQSLPFVKKFSA